MTVQITPATYENMCKYIWTKEWIEDQGWPVDKTDSTHWDTWHSPSRNISDIRSCEIYSTKHAHFHGHNTHSIVRRVQGEEARRGILRDLENAKGTKTNIKIDYGRPVIADGKYYMNNESFNWLALTAIIVVMISCYVSEFITGRLSK